MKYNGTDNIITDNDILVTSGNGSNKNLHTVIEKQQYDIDTLKSNVKWIYKYGGVGSGSGGGSGSGSGGGKWSFDVNINDVPLNVNSTLDLSKKLVGDIAPVTVSVTIKNPSVGGYQFKLQYGYDDGLFQTYPTFLTVENSCSATFNLKITKNSQLVIKVTDIDNNYKQSSFKYFIFGLDYSLTPMTYNNSGNLYELKDTDYKPSLFPRGVIYRLKINNFGGFQINYNVTNTIDYKIISINEQDYTKYNTDKNAGSYYDATDNSGYLANNDTTITLDYLITNETLRNELNFGTQTFIANINNLNNGQVIHNEVLQEYSIVPDTNQYVICLTESINGKVYNDKAGISTEEAEANAFYAGDYISFKLRPFNFASDSITINYTLINEDNGINTSSTINLKAGRYTSQTFNIYTGWNKLILNNDIVKYYYGKKVSADVKWYNKEGNDNSKYNDVDLSYVRFYDGISENMKDDPYFKQLYVNNYLELTRDINATDKIIDLYKNKTININNLNDTHFAFSIQLSASNDTNDVLFELKDNSHDTLFQITQSAIICNKFTKDNNIKVYIPKENNYVPSDLTKYHLVDIHIKKLDPYTLTKTVNNTDSVDMQYYLNDLEDDIPITNSTKGKQYVIEVYIDGITEGVTKTYFVTFPNIQYIYLKNVNVSYTLFELGKFENDKFKFNDIDACIYYYTYKYIITKGTGISEKNISLISQLSTLDYNATENKNDLSKQLILRKHNQLCLSKDYVSYLKAYLEIPIYIINVAHTRENDNTVSIFQWLNATYKETDNIESWPIQTTNINGKHKTGITYVAPDMKDGVEIEFPDDDAYTQALFKLDIQGSSTRENHGKNLDLSLVNKDTVTNTKLLFSPNFKENDSNTYLPESKFTLKADIVDSGHSNNAVMGKFINENTQKFNTESNGQYKNYIKNCLEGFPCVVILNVDYEIAGSTSEYYFLGIYNFNLGRGSYSNLGYVNNSIFNAKLQSVTNNNPFLFVKTTTDEYELRTDFGCAEITGNDPKFDFSQWDDTILYPFENESGNSYMWDDIVTSQEGAFKLALKYFVRDIAITGGYIFDYLGKEAIDHEKWDQAKWGYIGGVPDVTRQYSRNSQDLTHSFYNPAIKVPDKKTKWLKIFQRTMYDGYEYEGNTSYSRLDYTSAVEYYTICMAFGLVDSVQKNLNVKTWTLNKQNLKETDPEEKDLTRSKFYISFYDMDTCLGIDNNSNDTTTFCFSDYWQSSETEQNDIHVLTSINQYRDYFTNIDPITGKKNGEIGYDIPSSFLFAVAKYGTEVFNTDEQLSLDYLEYPTPTLLWIRYRASNTAAYDKPGTGSLQSADYFINTYYKKHLEGVNELVFNLNYKAKYLVYNIQEDWLFDPNNKDKFIGTYTISNKSEYTSGFHGDIEKFRGRSIHRVYDWLNSRLHILDAYFNLYDGYELLSVTDEERDHQIHKNENNMQLVQLRLTDPRVSVLAKLLNSAEDINIKDQIFKSGGDSDPKINFPTTPITLQVKAQNYSPIMFDVGGTIKAKYLLRSSANTYQITFSGSGNIAFALYGSNQITYMSNITWYTPTTMIIKSDNLTTIYGNNPNYNVAISKIESPALQSIDLTGSRYSGSLSLTESSKYVNLSTINISNSQINLTANEINVQSINVTNVYATNCDISKCSKLKTLKLNGLTLSNQLTLTVNYASNVLFNEIETKYFTVTSSVVNQNNTLVIDGSKNKFQTLKELTISGFAKVKIFNCPKLERINISEIVSGDATKDIYLTELAVINCSTDKTVTSFTVKSNTQKTIDLHSFSKLARVCFYGTQNFEQVILPETLGLYGSEFGNCKTLKYVDIYTNAGSKANKIIIKGYSPYRLYCDQRSSSDVGFNTYDVPNVGCFYNCYEFKMERSINDNSITPIRVDSSVTALNWLFGLDAAHENINLAKIANFIDNIPDNNNITNISNFCMLQTGIKLTKEQFIADGPDKSTLHLGKFARCTDLIDAFWCTNIYINKWIWYNSSKTQVFGATSINRLFGQGSFNVYMTIDCLYPIINKIKYLFATAEWESYIYPIYSGKSQTFNIYTILTDQKKKESAWLNSDIYTKQYTFNGTIGEIITNTPVPARALFVQENTARHTVDTEDNTNAIYPTAITNFSGVSLCDSNVIWDLYGLFSKKWNLKTIDCFQINSLYNPVEYEDLFNTAFMPKNLKNIGSSLRTSFSRNIDVDYNRFLDFKTLITNYNESAPTYALFNRHERAGDDLNCPTGLNFTKYISSDLFKEWMVEIFKANNSHGVINLFKNCNIFVSEAEARNNCDFRVSKIFEDCGEERTIINTKIHNIYCLFYNMHAYVKGAAVRDENIQYMEFGTDLFTYLPNITTVAYAFYNNYWNTAIPFNMFNKRYKCDDQFFYLEVNQNGQIAQESDTQKIRKRIKYVAYDYKQVMNQISGCFASVHFKPAPRDSVSPNSIINRYNRYNENVDIIKNAGINYYQFVNEDNTVINENEKFYLTEPITVKTRKTGSTSETIHPSYEYIDTLDLNGVFYEGEFKKAGTSTGFKDVTSSIQNAPMDKSISNYINSLIVAPDLLYGCTSSCTIQNLLSQDGVSRNMLCGILPKHFYKRMKTLNGGTYAVFTNCLVIPNYIGTYLDYNADGTRKLRYNVYSFIPEEFTTSDMTNLQDMFRFKIHWPKQGQMENGCQTYDFYVLSTSKSFDSNITSLENAFPVSLISNMQTYGETFIDYNTSNRSIHFNLQCTYLEEDYQENKKSEIFGNLNYNNLKYLRAFSTGLNMEIFTNLNVSNLIRHINILYGYFGNIFNQSYNVSNMILSENKYCISLTANSQWQSHQLSCNIVFPICSNTSETTRRLLNFTDIPANAKFNTLTNMFGTDSNRQFYKNMYDSFFIFTDNTKYQYSTFE